MRRGSRAGRTAGGAVIAVALAALGAGCTVGPAANRAENVNPAGHSRGPEEPSDDENSGSSWREDEPEPEETPPTLQPPEPAEPEGAAEVTEALAEGIDGLGNPCCTAVMPSGDVLVGDRDSGAVVRVTPEGDVSDVGVVHGVTLGPDHALLGMTVAPDSSSGPDELFVYYARSSDARVASYPLDESAPEGEQISTYPDTLLDNIPLGAAANGGALAFGPDGMLYAGTGQAGQGDAAASDPESLAGKILRIDPGSGGVPADNPFPGSHVYSSGHTDVRGLAWDGAERLWAVDGTELNAIAPGGDYAEQQEPVYDWADAGAEPAGLAYAPASRSFWMASATDSGLWRVPLNGEDVTLVADPALLDDGQLAQPRAVIPGTDDGEVLVLTASGGLFRVAVS